MNQSRKLHFRSTHRLLGHRYIQTNRPQCDLEEAHSGVTQWMDGNRAPGHGTTSIIFIRFHPSLHHQSPSRGDYNDQRDGIRQHDSLALPTMNAEKDCSLIDTTRNVTNHVTSPRNTSEAPPTGRSCKYTYCLSCLLTYKYLF